VFSDLFDPRRARWQGEGLPDGFAAAAVRVQPNHDRRS
jgi:hypothetical protein